MTKSRNTVLLAVVGILGLAWALGKKKEPTSPPMPSTSPPAGGASIVITIVDAQGNPVPES